MKILMISLDKRILDAKSQVAKRMISYSKKDELFIIVPHTKKFILDLNNKVHVFSTGGSKLKQYKLVKKIGSEICTNNKIDKITTQDPFLTGKAGLSLKNTYKIPLEVQLHGDFYGGNYYKSGSIKNKIYYHMGKVVLKEADVVRVVGERVKKSIEKLGVAPGHIIVKSVESKSLYDLGSFDLKEKYTGYSKIFLSLGRLEKVKNNEFLLEIFSKLGKANLLLIVGDGSRLGYLKSMVTKLDLSDRVIFEGWTNSPHDYIKSADAVLFPSLSEGYGMVPMEAYELGTPVIMNDVGVANYELKPSEKVKIISVSDDNAWVKAIKEI